MIKKISDKKKQKIEVDLTGPNGNAFYLIGLAKSLSDKLGLDAKSIRAEMTTGDYDNLINTFDKYFGDHVILYTK
jgi:hypothetical protein